jgi:hypothetical protein
MNLYPISQVTPQTNVVCNAEYWHNCLDQTNRCPICKDTHLENLRIIKFEIIDSCMKYVVRCVCHSCQVIFEKTYTCGGSCILRELIDEYLDEFEISKN